MKKSLVQPASAPRGPDDRAGGNASVGPNDAYIAAMADILDDAVLTDNVDGFEPLGVPVETY